MLPEVSGFLAVRHIHQYLNWLVQGKISTSEWHDQVLYSLLSTAELDWTQVVTAIPEPMRHGFASNLKANLRPEAVRGISHVFVAGPNEGSCADEIATAMGARMQRLDKFLATQKDFA